MRHFVKSVLLQAYLFTIEFLNITHNFFPSYLGTLYLRLFGIKLAYNSVLHRGCKFFGLGKFKAGSHVFIGPNCYLDNRRGITMGDNVELAHNVKIYTLGHNIESPRFETIGRSVVLENHVFIFSNAMIMPGVTIHEGGIVLPGSVVTKDVAPYTVVGGNPAKFIKVRPRDNKHYCFYPYIFAN